MTMEPGTPGANSAFGEFIEGDVLVEGKTIKAIGRNLHVGNAAEIDARGKVVMPGFIDTHHHQAWTAIRSSIPDSILINDVTGTASAEQNYAVNVLGYWRPRAGLRQPLHAGGRLHRRAVRRAFAARCRRHHGARHLADPSLEGALRLAAIQALRDTGRRAKFGFFESAGDVDGGSWYPIVRHLPPEQCPDLGQFDSSPW